jgi:ATP-dependent DNA helicase RecG
MDTDVTEVVRLLRARGTDLATVEAKAAAGGLPRSVRETLSAFSNGVGGTLLLGLEETTGFRPATGFDARKVRDDLASMCSDELYPPVRAEIEILEVDGALVVAAEIPELDLRHKPCYIKAKGEYGGSCIRGGDGDRRLTEYEIGILHANQGQPRDDHEAVPEAGLDDLDPDGVARLLRRVRAREAVAFAGVPDEVALKRLGVLVGREGEAVPTLAGLLALGAYPQQFFPQLNVTFIAVPATAKDRVPANGPRFLDNRTLNGSIPTIVEGAVTAAIRNTAVRGRVDGVGREDVYDYPVEALREAVTNALMHRDYGPYSRGTQVQIEMYQDRLEIRSPGGLFGTVTEDDLGQEGTSSSRNSYLARLLQDVALPGTDQVVCENRGSGIPAMIQALRRAGMTPPRFDSKIARFLVTFPKHALLDADVFRWIAGLGQQGLSDAQCMALALMRGGGSVTNGMLRQLGLERHDATAALSDLVTRGLAVRFGGRRYAEYLLVEELDRQPTLDFELGTAASGQTSVPRRDRLAEIDRLFDGAVVLRLADVQAATGLKPAMVRRYLSRLIAAGRIEPTAPTQSRSRAYRRADDRPPTDT